MHIKLPYSDSVKSCQRLYNERGAIAFKCDVLEALSPISKAMEIKKTLKTPFDPREII
jgi:hypothetical protein